MTGVAAVARTQEERTEAAKQRLREAALAVFGRDGYDAATLSSISLKAGFSRTLAQYHYTDKSALALELLDERIKRDNHLELLECRDDAGPAKAWDCLIRHLDAVADYYARLHGSCDLGVTVRGEMALHSAALMGADGAMTARVHELTVDLIARIERLFLICRDGGWIDKDADCHGLAILHVHSIWGLAQALFANPKAIRPVMAAFTQIGVMLKALRLPKDHRKAADMAVVKLVADYDPEPCTGCKLCDIVCPSGAIRMVARRPVIDDALCIGCGRCVDRCPEDIMWMEERGEPLVTTVRPEEVDQAEVAALLHKAGIEPSVSVCVCTLTPGSEIAAAVVKGAQTLEEVCAMTGMRSGCGIYCVAPALRLLEAAGRDMTPPGQHRWYPTTLSLYDLSDETCALYPDAYIAEDRGVFDPEHKYGPLPKVKV